MRWQLLAPWWVILTLALCAAAGFGWLFYTAKEMPKPLFHRWLGRAGLTLLLLLVTLGPSVPGGTSAPGLANLEVIFVVDTTASMGAEDYSGNQLRIVGVKKDLQALGQKLKGAHMSIITFDSKVNTILSSSTYASTFAAGVQLLNPEPYGSFQGSALDRPLDHLSKALRDIKARHPERNRLVFYMSDGEQTADKEVKSYKNLQGSVDGGAVIGYGTSKGAKIHKYSGVDGSTAQNEVKYVNTVDPITNKLVPALSKTDESKLRKIADELGILYQNRNNGGQEEALYQASKAKLYVDHGRKIIHYFNLYWLFAVPAVVLIFFEWKRAIELIQETVKQEKNTYGK